MEVFDEESEETNVDFIDTTEKPNANGTDSSEAIFTPKLDELVHDDSTGLHRKDETKLDGQNNGDERSGITTRDLIATQEDGGSFMRRKYAHEG